MAAPVLPQTYRSAPARRAPARRHPHLRVIEGGRTASSAALRTYTIRRVVVVVVLALLAVVALRVAALGVSAAVASSATATNGAVAEVVHTTRPGDTLWGVAIRYAPEVDPRIAIDDLIALNGGAALQVGQRVLLPAEWF